MVKKILSRGAIEARIANGETIVIVDQMVLKLDSWLPYHPGGSKAISHVVGKDCTDEVNALHSVDTRAKMKNFRIGWIEGEWNNFRPPNHGGKFNRLEDQPREESSSDDSSSGNEDLDVVIPAEPPFATSSDFLAGATLEDTTDSGTESSASDASDGPIVDPQIRRRRRGGQLDVFGEALTPMTSTSSLPALVKEDADDDTEVDAEALKQAERLKWLEAEKQKRLDYERAKYPSVDAETQRNITEKYRVLDKKLRSEGYYDCNYTAYCYEVSRYLLFISTSLYLVHLGWYKTGAFFMGLFWHQIAFTAHDAGHMGITHNFLYDSMIGIFIADFCGGLSLGWWKSSHNVHHIITNEPEHDPDIQLLPFFAISNRFFKGLYSTYYSRMMEYDAFAAFVVQFQNMLYYPLLAFGRFNMYVLSWDFILNASKSRGANWWHRWAEIIGMSVFWTWFGYGIVFNSIDNWFDRIAFVLISHITVLPLHVQITLSHFAMSTADAGDDESFPQRMIRTTMDVNCPRWMDWVHGGLQFQAIHHLYPRIPRHNLRKTQPLVIEFCKEVGLPYALYGFYEGNKEVISHLGEIGHQASIFRECQQYCAQAAATNGKIDI